MTSQTANFHVTYLMQIAFGVTQENNSVPLLDTNGDSSETGEWTVPYDFSFNRLLARHWTRGVVRATGISVQGVLWETKTSFRDFGLGNTIVT